MAMIGLASDDLYCYNDEIGRLRQELAAMEHAYDLMKFANETNMKTIVRLMEKNAKLAEENEVLEQNQKDMNKAIRESEAEIARLEYDLQQLRLTC